GSWNALLELLKNSQTNPNVVLPYNSQNVQLINVSDCLIATESSKKVVLIGVKDLIVVESQEGILIAHRSQDQKVKEIT
ncbi:MAG: mannose-1-phosphate guanylyltransferase/mannose-6-phosphate isomerase, partial [Deltaproteobacteria bacterium]